MYIPGALTDGFDALGNVTSSAIQTNAEAFYAAISDATDWTPVVLHKVDNVESISIVSALVVAPTVSFLRRRYR
jgi:hypothetical protein